jgi:hypothetical protein
VSIWHARWRQGGTDALRSRGPTGPAPKVSDVQLGQIEQEGRLAADQANAQRRKACLVFFDESALSLTPNVRRTWAPRGQPPVLVHPFNWKKASMAAALC